MCNHFGIDTHDRDVGLLNYQQARFSFLCESFTVNVEIVLQVTN